MELPSDHFGALVFKMLGGGGVAVGIYVIGTLVVKVLYPGAGNVSGD